MHRDDVLCTASSLDVRVAGRGNTTVRLPGGPAIDGGPNILAILAAFSRPRALQDGLDELARGVASRAAFVEIMARVVDLSQGRVLVRAADTDQPPPLALGFAGAASHIAMLSDRRRTDAFIEAVRATVRPGDVVIDLGTGTGVLAIAAARAGARRVYAIEAGSMADTADAMFAANGVGDRVTLVKGWSTEVELPERADVLVTETLGDNPWEEGWPHLVSDAWHRLLRRDARVIPSHVQWFAQPVAVPMALLDKARFSPALTSEWSSWYGLDFSALVTTGDRHTEVIRAAPHRVADWPTPCAPIALADCSAAGHLAGTNEGQSVVTAQGDISGVALFWEADLTPGIHLSTAPGRATEDGSWRVLIVPTPDTHHVRPGDVVTVSVTSSHPPSVRLHTTSPGEPST